MAPATAAAAPAEFQAAGLTQLVLELSAPYELAGLELHLSFDPALFKAGKADTSGPLSDHMCMDNPNIAGGYKCICAQVVDLKTVSGLRP